MMLIYTNSFVNDHLSECLHDGKWCLIKRSLHKSQVVHHKDKEYMGNPDNSLPARLKTVLKQKQEILVIAITTTCKEQILLYIIHSTVWDSVIEMATYMIQPYVVFYNTYQSVTIGGEQTALMQYWSWVNWHPNRYVAAISRHLSLGFEQAVGRINLMTACKDKPGKHAKQWVRGYRCMSRSKTIYYTWLEK
jgi:hypothetical protein